ncbi:hypothetical protein PVAND_012477 [Polypedilum vanderplanki]|uniref:LITAF domain-containing protein n=1 Tax=Polypedilum vanderplanki TaxID=319348 RepID=A0A9J6CMJ6_POLVA|nr:hypothetical protein PVAND_012477 [Polypedilum vanderplanki]
MSEAPKLTVNEFDPQASGFILPTPSLLPPPAYNPSMTLPPEPQREFTVVHQPGIQTVKIEHSTITYGSESQKMTCMWCKSEINTHIEHKANTRTHLVAVLLTVVGLCLLPYICSSCQSQQHYCPNCKRFLGTHDN